jgi:glycosyltransferase involved in cell wall biosynthesis
VKRYRIEDRVSLHLRYFSDDEMNDVFRAADAMVVCHRPGFQGESGILFHAIAHRKPILASAPGHTADLVRQKGLGCAFEFGDGNSFHAAVERLLTGTDVERSSRSRALDQSAHELSWTAVSEKYFAVYSSLLSLPAGVGNV